MQLTIGPVLYHWPRSELFNFYERLLQLPVDRVYLGETVCSKRRELRTAEWIELGRYLASRGREAVLSTLALIEAESELATLRRLCDNGELQVEAGDMAAVQMLTERRLPYVAGPSVNIYNPRALGLLCRTGLQRWVPPVELSGEALRTLLAAARRDGHRPETEVFAWGRLPLAWSARCFTARAHGRPKDDCGFVCREYPDGLPLDTRDGEPFLTLNGIQTQSARIQDLRAFLPEMRAMGIAAVRLSPAAEAFEAVVRGWRQSLDIPGAQAPGAVGRQACSGYWRGAAGMWTSAADG